MSDICKILVLNPGSTSTKVAYYENEKRIDEVNLDIDRAAIKGMPSIFDQLPLRRATIDEYVAKLGMSYSDFSFVVSRGCGGGNQKGGGYLVDEAYVGQCYAYTTPHASSLGPVMAHQIGKDFGIPAYVYDAEGVNEFNDLAILSGIKDFPIAPGSHTLNAKAAARKAAAILGGTWEDYNLIVCHLGGGTSVSFHEKGKLIDSCSEGYAPERAGAIPMYAEINFVKACFSGKYTEKEMIGRLFGAGGLVSYLGTADLREVERRIKEGDKEAEYYYDGMVYTQAKDIGAMSTVACGKVDAIVLTGGMAYSEMLVKKLTEKVQYLAPVIVVAGSHEMESLATGGLRVFKGEEPYHLFGTDQ